jgi:hypothetical protein
MRVRVEIGEEVIREVAIESLGRELSKKERGELREFVIDEINWITDGLVIAGISEMERGA